MSEFNTLAISLTVLAVIALVVFLILKNKKDKDSLNPDAPDTVEETHMDQKRRTDKV